MSTSLLNILSKESYLVLKMSYSGSAARDASVSACCKKFEREFFSFQLFQKSLKEEKNCFLLYDTTFPSLFLF